MSTHFDPGEPRHTVGSSFERGEGRMLSPSDGPLPAGPSPVTSSRALTRGFLAGAVVALLGALLWAVVAIATGYDIGIVAALVGAATGLTVVLVAGGPVGAFERGLVSLFAAGTIIVGYYVIFVHEVGGGYFDGHSISFFVNHFGEDVGFRPIDWVWILLAVVAAFRVSGSRAAQGRPSQ